MFELFLGLAHFSISVVVASGDASPVSRSFFFVLKISVTAVRMEQPSSNSSLPSDQPGPTRMAMHSNGVCEVITYASRLHAWRSFRSLYSDGVDPSALPTAGAPPAVPRVEFLCLESHRWRTGHGFCMPLDFSTRVARSAASHHMQRSACGGGWGTAEVIIEKFVVSNKVFRFVDLVMLHFLACQALVDTWWTESCRVKTVGALFDRKRWCSTATMLARSAQLGLPICCVVYRSDTLTGPTTASKIFAQSLWHIFWAATVI